MSLKPKTPMDASIDKACGITPATLRDAKAAQRRQTDIMTRLFSAIDAWNRTDTPASARKLRKAWEAVLAEDANASKAKRKPAVAQMAKFTKGARVRFKDSGLYGVVTRVSRPVGTYAWHYTVRIGNYACERVPESRLD